MQFKVFDLGLVDFKIALRYQREIFDKVKAGALSSALILCRHYSVITLGRHTSKKNILVSEHELSARGIQVHIIERGGDVTYHGPGQIIVYPVFNLNYVKKDIHFFLRQLETATLNFLSDFGIDASRKEGFTGAWVGEKKIASIGIAIKNWITFHGVSIQMKKGDLYNFHVIKPCGLDSTMTSVETVLDKEIEIDAPETKERLIQNFKNIFCVDTP